MRWLPGVTSLAVRFIVCQIYIAKRVCRKCILIRYIGVGGCPGFILFNTELVRIEMMMHVIIADMDKVGECRNVLIAMAHWYFTRLAACG